LATIDTQTVSLPAARPSIWSLAVPSILGNLLFSLVAIVQTKFVGMLGAEAVAAVGAGQRVFFALQAILMAVSAGTTALVARAWGAGDQREASRVTMASLTLAGAAGAVITVLGMTFSAPIAGIFGLDDATVRLAADNIFWLSAFVIGFSINIIIASALRAAGDAWTPLVLGGAVNVINVPLLYMFIFGKWGAPEMGAPGAAFATGLSLAIGGAAMLWLWMSQRLVIRYVKGGWARRERYGRLLHIGYPAGVEQVVFQAGFFTFLMLIGIYYGTEAFAAYNVGVNMLNIGMVVGFGFSIAGATLVGQNLGAGDYEAAARSGWRACALAAVSMGVLGLVTAFFAEPFARFFLGDDHVTVQRTVEFTYILAAMLPLLGVEVAIGGSLRGAGDTRFPLYSTFVGLIGMRCGLAILFTWMGLPVIWVYGAIIGDYVVKGGMLLWRFHSGRWKSVVSNSDLGV
jgi:putative MATE family efflux protein